MIGSINRGYALIGMRDAWTGSVVSTKIITETRKKDTRKSRGLGWEKKTAATTTDLYTLPPFSQSAFSRRATRRTGCHPSCPQRLFLLLRFYFVYFFVFSLASSSLERDRREKEIETERRAGESTKRRDKRLQVPHPPLYRVSHNSTS